MLAALKERGLKERGLPDGAMTLYHLVGRETANPDHPAVKPFSLQFARLSPYTAAEILGLTEPQHQRFMQAYDIAKEVLRELGIFPAFKNDDQERRAMEIDEFERGYPRLTLTMMMDVVGACRRTVENAKEEKGDKGEKGPEFVPQDGQLATPKGKETLKKKIHAAGRLDSPVSWCALLGRLSRLERLKVFDSPSATAGPLNYKDLLMPGSVSVIDLSDSGMSELTNIVISDMLRGVQEVQDEAYQKYEKAKKENSDTPPPTRTVIVIEEAHEFLNSDRIEKMKILFQQVARIAKRGRKRWLGLAFVTQLPQQLPPQVFGLVNSYILHKITDSDVVSKLRRTVSGIDEGLWNRLSGLAPGQAIASFPHMARPLLVSIDPTPCELRLVD